LEFNVPFQHKYGYIRDEINAKKSCTVILALFSSLAKNMQIGHTKYSTAWLFASAATQKKRYCGKTLSRTKSGRFRHW